MAASKACLQAPSPPTLVSSTRSAREVFRPISHNGAWSQAIEFDTENPGCVSTNNFKYMQDTEKFYA